MHADLDAFQDHDVLAKPAVIPDAHGRGNQRQLKGVNVLHREPMIVVTHGDIRAEEHVRSDGDRVGRTHAAITFKVCPPTDRDGAWLCSWALANRLQPSMGPDEHTIVNADPIRPRQDIDRPSDPASTPKAAETSAQPSVPQVGEGLTDDARDLHRPMLSARQATGAGRATGGARGGWARVRRLGGCHPYDLSMTSAVAASSPLVAIVVVTYNNLADTRDCLASIGAIRYPRLLVVVVDNGSTPREDEVLRSELGDAADVLRVATNHGYGPGANVGIEYALTLGADFIWLLNNDALVDATSLGELVNAAISDEDAGVLSPVINAPPSPEAPSGIWYAGGAIDLKHALVAHAPVVAIADTPYRTGYVTGCAMMVRSSVFREVGLLREDLYLYWEDVDLNLRALRAGWGLLVVPRAKAFHKVHGSIPPALIRRYPERNALWIVALHGSMMLFAQAAAHRGTRVARAWVAAMLRRRSAPSPETVGYLLGVIGAGGARSRAPRHPEPA